MGATAVSHAQISPYPVVVTMTGPATAVSGQEITYLVKYSLTDPETVSSTGFSLVIPRDTTFVSSEVVSGPAGAFSGEMAGSVRWSFVGSGEETEGELALTVRIDETFVGLIHGSCFIPGTETFNPESRCSIETEVFAVGALPEAGAGAPAAGFGIPVAPALPALAGAALLCASAAIHRQGSALAARERYSHQRTS